jgi:hypothetical protein
VEEHGSKNPARTDLRYRTTDISKLTMSNWNPVWVSRVYDPLVNNQWIEHRQMAEWCERNCSDEWSEGWWQEDLAFWFKSQFDAILFRMVWR